MEVKKKLQLCILVYSILLILIVIVINFFQTKSTYFRWGVPNKDEEPLIIISVNIDNYYKYFSLLFLITIIRIIKVGVNEIANPIITFNIYNPDKKNIEDFGKNELQFYGNMLYLIDNLRYVFTLMITISQIDLAIYGVLVGEITSIFTIRMLLNEKTFNNNYLEMI
tara:strand:- start:350 stop:850 length:501 start_codon:yes stop_codon:yes gene_type:complete